MLKEKNKISMQKEDLRKYNPEGSTLRKAQLCMLSMAPALAYYHGYAEHKTILAI